MTNKKLMSSKEAIKFFIDRGYDRDELVQYTPIEISFLATDQKAREDAANS